MICVYEKSHCFSCSIVLILAISESLVVLSRDERCARISHIKRRASACDGYIPRAPRYARASPESRCILQECPPMMSSVAICSWGILRTRIFSPIRIFVWSTRISTCSYGLLTSAIPSISILALSVAMASVFSLEVAWSPIISVVMVICPLWRAMTLPVNCAQDSTDMCRWYSPTMLGRNTYIMCSSFGTTILWLVSSPWSIRMWDEVCERGILWFGRFMMFHFGLFFP